MRLFELPDVLSFRRRERDALGELVNDFAEFFSTSASRGFRVLVSLGAWNRKCELMSYGSLLGLCLL